MSRDKTTATTAAKPMDAAGFTRGISSLMRTSGKLDELVAYAYVKDCATGNPDHLNRIYDAVCRLPGRKLKSSIENWIAEFTQFRVKDNGNMGVKAKAYNAPQFLSFSAYLENKEAKAKAARSQSAQLRAAEKKRLEKEGATAEEICAEALTALDKVAKRLGVPVDRILNSLAKAEATADAMNITPEAKAAKAA